MDTLFETKEQSIPHTPALLFDCVMADGTVEHWSTQRLSAGTVVYSPRVGKHSIFETQQATDHGADSIPRISLELANADSHFSELERSTGFKGARLTARFGFFDVLTGILKTELALLFQGIVNSPDSITESTFRMSAINRLSMQRVVLPSMRIQRRCAWEFPKTAAQRTEAANGGVSGKFSRFYSCGYSPDVSGGAGNLDGTAPFTSCSFTRADCTARGMLDHDSHHRPTARFSGIEFVPSTIQVRTAGDKNSHLSPVSLNETRYNDFVPIVYGTAWFAPEIVFARNDGNLTRMEVLLGLGEISGVHKVLVNGVEIPAGHSGTNMTGTGWFNTISSGTRNGAFNGDFTTSTGAPLGDPYGGMAFLSVVVPNRINDGQTLPSIQVLVDGLKLRQYDSAGTVATEAFTNSPVWIILDLLLRNGWSASEIDLASFASAAAYCAESIPVMDLNGNQTATARFQCNLVLRGRRTAGDILRGIRTTARLYLIFGTNGLLQLRVENSLALQNGRKPATTNSQLTLNGGWPSYEFGDGTGGTTGIMRNEDGSSTVRVWTRGAADTPNRYSVEFQDSFNEYQQDSYSLVDEEDAARTGQEIHATLNSVGMPNYDQAARIVKFQLDKSLRGNLMVEFQTSVRAFGLQPGDLITFTYLKEGFVRTPFRIMNVLPALNYRTVTISAQLHDDSWYADDNGQSASAGGRRLAAYGIGLPRPVTGVIANAWGELDFEVRESSSVAPDGTNTLTASVRFISPQAVPDSAPAIPLISLAVLVSSTGGTIAGGQNLYYAVSAVDANGNESALSFVARAFVPATTSTNQITLQGLSFTADATSFVVYRGPTPSQLVKIGVGSVSSTTFVDSGLTSQAVLPPDPNYDHTNIYWRLELHPEVSATSVGPSSIGNDALRLPVNEYAGATVRILRGKGAGQELEVASNSGTLLTMKRAWVIEPDATSVFVIAQSGYQFGATGKTDRLQFTIPNRQDAVIHISGRSANSFDVECPYEISPLTRWKIGGAGIRTVDADVPGLPVFGVGLAPNLGGTLELAAIGFMDHANTSSITAGTYKFYFYDELAGTPSQTLSVALDLQATTLTASAALDVRPGSVLQVERELLLVTSLSADQLTVVVARGELGSRTATHDAGSSIYILKSQVTIVPFSRNFFGSPACGNWGYSVSIPNVRVAAVELFVTNSQGNSPTATGCLTNTIDQGLRTLSGGQYTFQVAGFLAVQTDAAPGLVVEADHAIRDVFAVLGSAASAAVQLRINQNGMAFCTLAFAGGGLVSNSVNGQTLPVLRAGDVLTMDILAVGDILPGSDLTLMVRV